MAYKNISKADWEKLRDKLNGISPNEQQDVVSETSGSTGIAQELNGISFTDPADNTPKTEVPHKAAAQSAKHDEFEVSLNGISFADAANNVTETVKADVAESVKKAVKQEIVDNKENTPKPEAVKKAVETVKTETAQSVKKAVKQEIIDNKENTPKPEAVKKAVETVKAETAQSVKKAVKQEAAESAKKANNAKPFENAAASKADVPVSDDDTGVFFFGQSSGRKWESAESKKEAWSSSIARNADKQASENTERHAKSAQTKQAKPAANSESVRREQNITAETVKPNTENRIERTAKSANTEPAKPAVKSESVRPVQNIIVETVQPAEKHEPVRPVRESAAEPVKQSAAKKAAAPESAKPKAAPQKEQGVLGSKEPAAGEVYITNTPADSEIESITETWLISEPQHEEAKPRQKAFWEEDAEPLKAENAQKPAEPVHKKEDNGSNGKKDVGKALAENGVSMRFIITAAIVCTAVCVIVGVVIGVLIGISFIA